MAQDKLDSVTRVGKPVVRRKKGDFSSRRSTQVVGVTEDKVRARDGDNLYILERIQTRETASVIHRPLYLHYRESPAGRRHRAARRLRAVRTILDATGAARADKTSTREGVDRLRPRLRVGTNSPLGFLGTTRCVEEAWRPVG